MSDRWRFLGWNGRSIHALIMEVEEPILERFFSQRLAVAGSSGHGWLHAVGTYRWPFGVWEPRLWLRPWHRRSQSNGAGERFSIWNLCPKHFSRQLTLKRRNMFKTFSDSCVAATGKLIMKVHEKRWQKHARESTRQEVDQSSTAGISMHPDNLPYPLRRKSEGSTHVSGA